MTKKGVTKHEKEKHVTLIAKSDSGWTKVKKVARTKKMGQGGG